jgi:hypothetical protein
MRKVTLPPRAAILTFPLDVLKESAELSKLPHLDDAISSALVTFLAITLAAQSKTLTVFARSKTGIVGSNPTQDMDVSVRLFFVCAVLCVGSGLTTG